MNLREYLKLIGLLVVSFIVAYLLIYLFINIVNKSTDIVSIFLIMPSIVAAAAFIALLNLRKISKNKIKTLKWKQREQTSKLIKPFQSTEEVFKEITTNPILRSAILSAYQTHLKDTLGTLSFHASYSEVIKKYINNLKKTNYKEYIEYEKKVIDAFNIYNSIQAQYAHGLLDKKLAKEQFAHKLKLNSFVHIAIIRVFLPHANLDKLISLFKEWNIDHIHQPKQR